jgi:Uma2 family endonuclease
LFQSKSICAPRIARIATTWTERYWNATWAKLQREFIFFLRTRSKQWGIHVFPEQRVQVSARRFRIPDICVILGREPEDQIFRQPPFICIEILSKDDSLISMQERIDDYLKFGVSYVWVINPVNRRAWVYSAEGIREIKDGVLRTDNPSIELPLDLPNS